MVQTYSRNNLGYNGFLNGVMPRLTKLGLQLTNVHRLAQREYRTLWTQPHLCFRDIRYLE